MPAGSRRWVLTGGIGSGKSTVRRLLEAADVYTIDADTIGHEVLEPGGAAFSAVVERWPEVAEDGRIHRRRLANIVFGDVEQLRALEAITHPHIFGTIQRRLEVFQGDVAVVEIPLIQDSLGSEWKRIVVDCPDDLRLERALDRGMDRDDVIARMDSQPNRGIWLAAADIVVPNTGSEEELGDMVALLVGVL